MACSSFVARVPAEVAVGDDVTGPAAMNAAASLSPVSPVSPLPTLKKMGSSMISLAGPDLPVHFSQISIASNRFSYDPWSQSHSGSGGKGEAAYTSPLTSASFRQQMDKDRSFTASAPPGARPPCRKPSATSIMQFDDSDGGDERDYGVEPRRDTL